MRSVLEACKPRSEIITGTFNPEIFTASLSPIIDHYRNKTGIIDTIYTDAKLFFSQATYPTQELRMVLGEIFGRLAGDSTVPAIHRLETAFGGGKTHTLIACTHIAFGGKGLADFVQDVIDENLLPVPGSIAVVGIAGDEIPVHKPDGHELVPYTLWGEMAYQIGGEKLYNEVEAEASSYAAPGKTYFTKVLGNHKVLIMLDELAQYAARLDAARPDGGRMLAAFLMALFGHARNHAGISIVLTLAGAADAFAKQTHTLAKLIGQVRGEEVSEDEALGIGERAVREVMSVVSRDATSVTPVQAAEVSRVLAKRLFEAIDYEAAQVTADEYTKMYHKNASSLPDQATRSDFKERMVGHYPFHPTLLDYLNNKLSVAENFQGTRGVLRLLALAVKSLWQKEKAVPMVHTCHLDLRNARVVNEILGRTGSSDLLPILNADIGGVDTGQLESGYSNAELADKRNPHPEGHPMYEYTWKTVFLNSLVDRDKGMESNLFGLNEQDALFNVSFPGLTPPQVAIALKAIKEINEGAYYLRCDQGRYYADTVPTIGKILAGIRKTLTFDQVSELLAASARKVIKGDIGRFHIEHDVSEPEHIPDGKDKPVLGLVSLNADYIDPEAFVTTRGLNQPRVQQNLVFLLVPETASIKNPSEDEGDLLAMQSSRAIKARQRLEDIARQVKAMRILAGKPQNYGLDPRHLDEEEFKSRYSEREQALVTSVSQIYNTLWYPSTSGKIIGKEIKTAGGEGGVAFIQRIREILLKDNELITPEHITQSDLMNLKKLFFEQGDIETLEKLHQNFSNLRRWPVLENERVFEPIIRQGVSKGMWYVFRMENDEKVKPGELYTQDNEVPLDVNLAAQGYSLVTPQGANQRSWTRVDKPDKTHIKDWAKEIIKEEEMLTMESLVEKVADKHGDVSDQDVQDAVYNLVKEDRLMAFQGSPTQDEKPDLVSGAAATLYTPKPQDVVITKAKAAEKGWVKPKTSSFTLSGKEGAQRLVPLLKRLGSLYTRGAKTPIDHLDLVDLELRQGGRLRLQLENASLESIKLLRELFEVLDSVVTMGENTEGYIEITDPHDDCPFIRELKK